jgi:hypothetical protein
MVDLVRRVKHAVFDFPDGMFHTLYTRDILNIRVTPIAIEPPRILLYP